ncbi:ATP-grasp domain-containing protein [Prevotella sp. E9-3]|uniref:ATP-grasp domain-containing protein n=1 Tax=Prevotella sp. E9-3 TaxID=2913621 RepID=UPI001EDAFAA5|nr:ATP-grasp domain-containing protein [Prevotella sp. E9-3]UKK49472.1 ATP-grasp domain-containing protein [Prevotella sp. E9-3]
MRRVIVIGHGYGIRLGVIRAVAQIACEVTVIHVRSFKTGFPTKPIDAYSKFVKEVLFFNRQEGAEGLVKLLLEKCAVEGQKPIIFPTSDFSALAIDDDEIKKHFAVPYIINNNSQFSILNSQFSIAYWMDKSHQKALALSVGLSTAVSVVIEKRGDGFQIPEGIKYPCFTKPVSSFGAGKKCQRRCNNPEELKAVLAIADKNDITKVLIEDFIDISHEYAVLGYSDGTNVIIPGIIKFLKESKRHRGVALAGEVLPTAGFEDLIGKFAEFIRQMGFVGVFDIDFLESNGIFYFDEMNLRTGGSGMAILKAGVNLPAMFVKLMCGDSTDDMTQTVTHAATFVNEKMALDDFSEGCMSFREYRKLLAAADIHFIKDETDDAPYKVFEKQFREQLYSFKRIAKRVLHIF